MKISTISHSDFDDVLALNEASLPHVSRVDLAEMAWFADNAAFFGVVKDRSRLAGFLIGLRPGTSYKSINYRWFCDHYDDFAYIDRIAISPWAQRRGLGYQLYDAFAVSQHGAPLLCCEVNIRPPNDPSMRFHLQQNFREVATQETEGGQKEVAMLVKDL